MNSFPADEEVLTSLRTLIAERGLRFPIVSRAAFVDQMVGTVSFLGVDYDGASASRLVPEFFFPTPSADDPVRKTVELVTSRGFVRHARPDRPRLGAEVVDRNSPTAEVAAVVAAVARDVAEGTEDEFVQAMDVLTHALEFDETSDALTIWRAALHRGVLLPEGSSALRSLVGYLLAQASAGDSRAYSEICDCLAFIQPFTREPEGEEMAHEFSSDDLPLLNSILAMHPELQETLVAVKQVQERGGFPIDSFDDLVERLGGEDASVTFRGQPLSLRSIQRHIPPYYFPISSERDFLAKTTDLRHRVAEEPGVPTTAQTASVEQAPTGGGTPPPLTSEEVFAQTRHLPGNAGLARFPQ